MDAASMGILIFGIIVFMAACVGLVIMIRMTIKKKKTKGEKDEPKIERSVLEILPVRKYDTEKHCYELDDGSLMDLFKIATKDQNSASSVERDWDNMKYAKFFKMYADDIKIFALNYPCNTQQQQKYWKHKIEGTTNKTLERLQKQRLYQLEWLEKHNTSREFYMMITARDYDDFLKKKSTVLTVLGVGREGLVETMDANKKHQILFKLNNKSSYIF